MKACLFICFWSTWHSTFFLPVSVKTARRKVMCVSLPRWLLPVTRFSVITSIPVLPFIKLKLSHWTWPFYWKYLTDVFQYFPLNPMYLPDLCDKHFAWWNTINDCAFLLLYLQQIQDTHWGTSIQLPIWKAAFNFFFYWKLYKEKEIWFWRSDFILLFIYLRSIGDTSAPSHI